MYVREINLVFMYVSFFFLFSQTGEYNAVNNHNRLYYIQNSGCNRWWWNLGAIFQEGAWQGESHVVFERKCLLVWWAVCKNKISPRGYTGYRNFLGHIYWAILAIFWVCNVEYKKCMLYETCIYVQNVNLDDSTCPSPI